MEDSRKLRILKTPHFDLAYPETSDKIASLFLSGASRFRDGLDILMIQTNQSGNFDEGLCRQRLLVATPTS